MVISTHLFLLCTTGIITVTVVITSAIDFHISATTSSATTNTQSVNHSPSSLATTTDTFLTTDVHTIATTSMFISITSSANPITTFTNSPSLSTSPQSNDGSVYFSVGVLVVIATILLVIFIIITVVVVIIIAVCYKEKRNKQCTKEEIRNHNYRMILQTLSMNKSGVVNKPDVVNNEVEAQDGEDHQCNVPVSNSVEKPLKTAEDPAYSTLPRQKCSSPKVNHQQHSQYISIEDPQDIYMVVV